MQEIQTHTLKTTCIFVRKSKAKTEHEIEKKKNLLGLSKVTENT